VQMDSIAISPSELNNSERGRHQMWPT